MARGSVTPIFCLIVSVLAAGGCSARLVHQDGLDATAKIAVASVVMPRIADTARDADRKVLQAAVDHAASQVSAGLTGVRSWKVLDAAAIGGGKALHSFGKPSPKDFEALFPQEEERDRARHAAIAELASWRERFIAAAGMPIIPREAFAPDEEPAQIDPAARTVMLHQAAELCKALGVDAVAFAHVRCAVSHPRENAFIVTDERTDGLLALSATLVIVDRTGRIIVDMGPRRIDLSSPSRDMLPLYRGAGKEAVTAAKIDLADPKKMVPRALTQLTEEAVADLMAGLKEGIRQ